jgi:hypothetical protein
MPYMLVIEAGSIRADFGSVEWAGEACGVRYAVSSATVSSRRSKSIGLVM